jgi:hypothetical protein
MLRDPEDYVIKSRSPSLALSLSRNIKSLSYQGIISQLFTRDL